MPSGRPFPRRDSLLLDQARETLLSQAGGLDQADLRAQARRHLSAIRP